MCAGVGRYWSEYLSGEADRHAQRLEVTSAIGISRARVAESHRLATPGREVTVRWQRWPSVLSQATGKTGMDAVYWRVVVWMMVASLAWLGLICPPASACGESERGSSEQEVVRASVSCDIDSPTRSSELGKSSLPVHDHPHRAWLCECDGSQGLILWALGYHVAVRANPWRVREPCPEGGGRQLFMPLGFFPRR